jgi:hypothetical protein
MFSTNTIKQYSSEGGHRKQSRKHQVTRHSNFLNKIQLYFEVRKEKQTQVHSSKFPENQETLFYK